MSISATNSITGGAKNKAYALDRAIKDYEIARSNGTRRRQLGMMKSGRMHIAHCTKCKRGLNGHIAKLQRENNVENNPICIPCIEGRARKPLVNGKNI